MELKDEEIVELFFDVVKQNRRYSEKRYGSMHPFRGQYYCLMVLSSAGELNQKELAHLLGIRPSSAGELIAKLEQKGWVRRKSYPSDRRSSIVSLTKEGEIGSGRSREETGEAAQRYAGGTDGSGEDSFLRRTEENTASLHIHGELE